MLFITQGKTNWKFLAVVIILAVAVASGNFVYLKYFYQIPEFNNSVLRIFPTQEECEEKTGCTCVFVMCDIVPPGKTYEEVCGKDFKEGWQCVKQKQDETAGWQTYSNVEYGFEIKYPKDWMSEQNVYSVKPNLVFCPLDLTEVHTGETICKLKTGASKPQYEDGMIYLFNYASDPKPNNPDYRYLGVDNLGYYYVYSSASGNKSIINQMLSTFRFLK